MNILITIFIILASVLLIAIVFIQNPKGGGLSSDFGSAQQMGGVQKTNDFIDKSTWILAGLIAVLCVIMTIRTKSFVPVVKDQAPTEQADPNAPAQGQQVPQQEQ